MKIAFQFPAKFVFAESKVEPRKVDSEFPLYSFDNQNVYFCTKKEKVVHAKAEFNSYFLFINNHLFYFRTDGDDASAILRLNDLGERYENAFKKYYEYVNDPIAYVQEQAEIRERRRLEREATDREQQEQTERRAKASQEAFESALYEYKKGKHISWVHFERACKEYNLNIPIKTMGWARKHLTKIGSNRYSGVTKVKSESLFNLMRELKNKLENDSKS